MLRKAWNSRGSRPCGRAGSRRLVVVVGAAFGAAMAGALLAEGCSSGDDSGADADAGADAPMEIEVLHPDAAPLPGQTSCEVVITTGIPVGAIKHVPICTTVDYPTNPPSGGDHWPEWAIYQSYTEPVPREMYVHNMEHGGVVLAYRCATACPDVVAALETASHGSPNDCADLTNDTHSRIVVTPDPKLGEPIGLGAWGATYTATCIDPASLAAFVKSAYGKGPEHICVDGVGLPTGCDGG